MIITFPVKLAPLTVKVCAAEAMPCVAENEEKSEATAMAGWEPTTPETASAPSVAPSELMRMMPEAAPSGAVAAMRTEIVVAASAPDTGVNTREPA